MPMVRFITLHAGESQDNIDGGFDDAMIACLSGCRLRSKLLIVNGWLGRMDDEQESEGRSRESLGNGCVMQLG